MHTELHRVEIKLDELTVPKHLPNNLKKLKACYNLTDRELANKLSVKPTYISSVANWKATFSGGITIKLLKEFNINFSLFSNIKDTIHTNCYEYEYALIVISSDKCLSDLSIDELNTISTKYVTVYDDNELDTQISIILFSELITLSNSYEINAAKNFYLELGREKIDLFNRLLSDFSYNNDSNKFLYAVGAEIRKTKENQVTIDTVNSIDNNTCKVLSNIPFKKLKSVSLISSEYEINGSDVVLKKPYRILSEKGMKTVTKLKENEYKKVSNSSILFTAFTDEDVWNKLKAYRLLKNISSEYMATLLGIRKESYRLLEIGFNRLTTHQMWKIENKLGILIEYMVDLEKYYDKLNS